jgi:predicted ATPase
MLTKLVIENFRCIRNAEIALGPMTVLVGPNASGKTTILDALNLKGPATLRDQSWRARARPKLTAIDTRRGVLNGPGGGPGESWLTSGSQNLHLDVQRMRQQNLLAHAANLDPVGDNLTNVFGSLTRNQQMELSKTFCGLVPVFRDVDVAPTNQGQHELRFQDRWSESVWYRPSEVSDGTMLMLAYLILRFQQPQVELLTVEEPDRGLHPYLMEQLVGFFRMLSSGPPEGASNPIQVVIATHSAELLEYCLPEEVRFLDRDPKDGSVRVHQVDTSSSDWEKTFAAYRQSLGSVWLSGGLGGVPGR